MNFKNPRTALVALIAVAVGSYLYLASFKPKPSPPAATPPDAAGQGDEDGAATPKALVNSPRDKPPHP